MVVSDARRNDVVPGGRHLGYFEIDGIVRVWLTTATRPIEPKERDVWKSLMPRAQANAAILLRGEEDADYRALVVVDIADGTMGWVDLLVAQTGERRLGAF
jgi:hypothetical protein